MSCVGELWGAFSVRGLSLVLAFHPEWPREERHECLWDLKLIQGFHALSKLQLALVG